LIKADIGRLLKKECEIMNKLIPYIQAELEAGYSKEQIKEAILRRGYSEQEIEDAFNEISGQEKEEKVKETVSQPLSTEQPPQASQAVEQKVINRRFILILAGIVLLITTFLSIFYLATPQQPIETEGTAESGAELGETVGIGTKKIVQEETEEEREEKAEEGAEETELKAEQEGVIEAIKAIESGGPEIKIEELKFCNSIDEDYNCDENTDAEYRLGETVNILIKVINFTNLAYKDEETGKQGYLIGITQDIETRGPDFEILPSLTKEKVEDISSFVKEKVPFIYIANQLKTSPTFLTGEYAVEITITDKITEQVDSKMGLFWLVNESG
jgi:hypothetical protein